jgi:hypothetical protein
MVSMIGVLVNAFFIMVALAAVVYAVGGVICIGIVLKSIFFQKRKR